ncbi:39S ribosomal protein L34, mitochondrial [Pectinophora gossypiella]|uniref:39S ribosomal protein L34, mitochondrial n=1 Tax=Pectinophora gossypiella TaxID=13191 RepID=UPI00214E987C|nr:39S ribosomal protein L34, mitochondrial [Pectinophora gossypiella]
MSGLMSAALQPLRFLRQGLHTITQVSTSNSLVKPDNCLLSSIRTKVRCYFPRPNEVKRVRRHGWETRMSTPNGRKIIMRRLLKGRHVLSH